MDYSERLAKAFEGTKFEGVPNQSDAYPITDLGKRNIKELEKLNDKQIAMILDLCSEIFADVIQPRALEKFGSTDGPATASIIQDIFQLQPTLEKLGLDKQLQKEFMSMGLTEVQAKWLQECLVSDFTARFIQLITDLVNRWRLIPRATIQQTVSTLTAMFLEADHDDQN